MYSFFKFIFFSYFNYNAYFLKGLPVRMITTREKIETDLPFEIYGSYRFIATNSNKNIVYTAPIVKTFFLVCQAKIKMSPFYQNKNVTFVKN